MRTDPLRRALVALVVSVTIVATLAAVSTPAAAQTDGPPPSPVTTSDIENPTMLAILTSPDVVSRMIVVSTTDVREALADGIHTAARLVRPRQWGELSVDVAVLQTLIGVELVDGLYGPATARAHAAFLTDEEIDPAGIVPGESVPAGPTATSPAPDLAATPSADEPEPAPVTEPTSPTGSGAAEQATAEDTAPAPVAPSGGPTAEQWAALRFCESSGDYTAVHSSGAFRGAYQFSPRTWNWIAADHAPHLVGVDPAAAAPADQDLMARALYQVGGPGHWPVCGRYLY